MLMRTRLYTSEKMHEPSVHLHNTELERHYCICSSAQTESAISQPLSHFFHLTAILIGNFHMVFSVKMRSHESRRLVGLYLLCLFKNFLRVYLSSVFRGIVCIDVSSSSLHPFSTFSFLLLYLSGLHYAFQRGGFYLWCHHYVDGVVVKIDGCKVQRLIVD